jgi:hypothetical protein
VDKKTDRIANHQSKKKIDDSFAKQDTENKRKIVQK